MMIGIVSRLTDQKGFDLVAYKIEELCNGGCQVVVLGTGDEKYNYKDRTTDGGVRRVNFVNNYYKQGAVSKNMKIFSDIMLGSILTDSRHKFTFQMIWHVKFMRQVTHF